MYFLLSIITKQHKLQRKNMTQQYDENDFDGMGNQGRFPKNN